VCIWALSVHYAGVYLDSIDFVSIRYVGLTTLYLLCLVVFAALPYMVQSCSRVLQKKNSPETALAKFPSIKLIVNFTFYQSFVVCRRFFRADVLSLKSCVRC
jgi:hypothetical protein